MDDMTGRWNAWVRVLRQLEKTWEAHIEGLGGIHEIENLPLKLQTHLAQNWTRGEFMGMMQEVCSHMLAIGGLKELYIKRPENEKEKKEVETNGRT